MNWADRMWADAIAVAKAVTDTPEYKAHIAAVAARRSARMKAQQAAERRAYEAERDRKAAARAYDMGGCGDECTRFGIMDGCKPHCPVFDRGECPIQDENAALFAEESVEEGQPEKKERHK